MDADESKRVFQRLGYSNNSNFISNNNKHQKGCFHWGAGKCSRFPCPYLHRELPPPPRQQPRMGIGTAASSKRPLGFSDDHSNLPRLNSNFNNTWGRVTGGVRGGVVAVKEKSKSKYSFTFASSRSRHGMVQTATGLSLSGPVGQVHVVVVGNDLLFAGTQDGTMLASKFNAVGNSFQPAASLKGHNLAVVTLVGANKPYSGSMDNSIRVWSLETLQCVQTLTEHTSVVMSVLCWDQFLSSCSLDKTIKILSPGPSFMVNCNILMPLVYSNLVVPVMKVWVAAESGHLEVTYTHNEEHGLLTFCGMHDAEAKPVVLCSSNDNSIRVFDLPSQV